MFVFKVAVVGAGAMGSEIARGITSAGIPLVHCDVDSDHALDSAALGDVDLVIEAVAEQLEVKQQVFAQLDAATPGHAILASSTSAVSISEIADATSRPEQVVGMHFLAPASKRRLVEVVEGDETSPETVQAVVNFAQAIRKTAVRCAECPGFVVDRILTAMGGEPGSSVDPEPADRAVLDALAEACLVVEDGVAGIRDVDLGMALGAGMAPGPFARADQRGLDDVLAAMESADARGGDASQPPLMLRRLVAQGRLGAKAGQGFYPHPQPDEGYEQAVVKLDTRGDVAIAWLNNPPANSISAEVVAGLRRAWEAIEAADGIRAMVLASANPALFCAGADIKAFTRMDGAGGRELLESMHALLRGWERSRVTTVAAVNGPALGGGCELAMACDVRLAAGSASFGQPEVGLGIIPGFGGTQRLPRLVGEAKALEMNLTGEAIGAEDAWQHGLVNRVVADHELFDAALAFARKLAGQAPVAVEQIKRVSHRGDLDDGLGAEAEGFLAAFGSADAEEGIGAFLAKRTPKWTGS